MNSSSATRPPIPYVHQSTAPWLSRLVAGEAMNINGAAARRWLQVHSGSLWVTAARGTQGPVPREADIWLSAGESLELPPGTAWLLQAWPTAEMALLEHAAPEQPRALQARAARRLLPEWRSTAQRIATFVRWSRRWAAGLLQGHTACTQRA